MRGRRPGVGIERFWCLGCDLAWCLVVFWDGREIVGESGECRVVRELPGPERAVVVNEPESLILAQSERWRHA